jgi:hypothetical protein
MKKIKRLDFSKPLNESEDYSLDVTRERIRTILTRMLEDIDEIGGSKDILNKYTEELTECFNLCSNDKWRSLERDLTRMFDSDARVGLALLDTIRKH